MAANNSGAWDILKGSVQRERRETSRIAYMYSGERGNVLYTLYLKEIIVEYCRSQWPRGLRRRSAAARLLRLWVRIPPGIWMFVCCEYCVLSGRGLCGELITRPEESYRLWCVVVCDRETSWLRRPWPTGGLLRQIKKSWKITELLPIISWRCSEDG